MRRKEGVDKAIAFIREENEPDKISKRKNQKANRFKCPSLRGTNATEAIANSYHSMVRRCCNPKHDAYPRYGGKGIKVCATWIDHPASFVRWATENNLQKGETIDRIDPTKGYSPENCRVLSRSENSKRARTAHRITVHGVTDTASGWERALGMKRGQLNYIIRSRGIDAAIQTIKDTIVATAT